VADPKDASRAWMDSKLYEKNLLIGLQRLSKGEDLPAVLNHSLGEGCVGFPGRRFCDPVTSLKAKPPPLLGREELIGGKISGDRGQQESFPSRGGWEKRRSRKAAMKKPGPRHAIQGLPRTEKNGDKYKLLRAASRSPLKRRVPCSGLGSRTKGNSKADGYKWSEQQGANE